MPHHPEMRFVCDRCKGEEVTPTTDAVQSGRVKPPEKWLVMWLADSTSPPIYLCADCNPLFKRFMADKGYSGG